MISIELFSHGYIIRFCSWFKRSLVRDYGALFFW